MPLYRKKDFAKHCGKSPAHVSTALTRGQLIATADGYINSDEPQNFLTMNKWRIASGMDLIEDKAEDKAEDKVEPANETSADESTGVPEAAKKKTALTALNEEKTRADIEFKIEKAKETRLKNAKLRGELIPTSMVVDLFGMLGHQFQTQYEIGATNLVDDLAHRMKISPELQGKTRKKLTELINNAHQKAIKESKIAIRNIVSSVSGTEAEISDVDDSEIL